jgi:Tfp pilus assembly protein PilF
VASRPIRNSASAYNRLAEAYVANNQKELAIKSYEKSLELNPGDAKVREEVSRLRR